MFFFYGMVVARDERWGSSTMPGTRLYTDDTQFRQRPFAWKMIDPTEFRDVFGRAAGLPPQDRAAFLAHACDGNNPLLREVERLLAADSRLADPHRVALRRAR